jgi:hypothetical protein
MGRSAFLVAVLMYVALDLSLPTMPGAFVFDPDDSVESLQQVRARAGAEAETLPASADTAFGLAPVPRGAADRLAPTRPGPTRPRLSRRSAALDDPPPSSEDPH